MGTSRSSHGGGSTPHGRPAKPLCSTPPRPRPKLSDAVMADPRRAAAILAGRSKWANRTVLHYCFFSGGSHYAVPKSQADAVRHAFDSWKAVGIGLEFVEVDSLSEAEVRIGYSLADGSSASAVGRDILTIPLTEPTTVYGWDLTTPYGRGTALHELGHALGMEHEHQNPFAGIKWHEEAVYASLGAPPNNWSRATTFHNILEKLDAQQVQGSAWDPDSIMEYEFEAGLIDEPQKQADLPGRRRRQRRRPQREHRLQAVQGPHLPRAAAPLPAGPVGHDVVDGQLSGGASVPQWISSRRTPSRRPPRPRRRWRSR